MINTHTEYYRVYSFRPVPVFADARIQFAQARLAPFVRLSTGVSIKGYRQEYLEVASGDVQRVGKVVQPGFFVNTGGGILYRVSATTSLSVSGGLKAFHVSTNENEINPHGLAMQTGCVIRPRARRH
jgi:hypothetical protein